MGRKTPFGRKVIVTRDLISVHKYFALSSKKNVWFSRAAPNFSRTPEEFSGRKVDHDFSGFFSYIISFNEPLGSFVIQRADSFVYSNRSTIFR